MASLGSKRDLRFFHVKNKQEQGDANSRAPVKGVKPLGKWQLMLVCESRFRRLLCVLSLSAARQPPFPLLPSNTCYEGVLGLGEGLLWRRLGKGVSTRCAGEKSRANPLFQRLILQIEITPPSGKLRKTRLRRREKSQRSRTLPSAACTGKIAPRTRLQI